MCILTLLFDNLGLGVGSPEARLCPKDERAPIIPEKISGKDDST